MGQNLDGEASREILGRRQGFYRQGVEDRGLQRRFVTN